MRELESQILQVRKSRRDDSSRQVLELVSPVPPVEMMSLNDRIENTGIL